MTPNIDMPLLARELLKATRGKRSQLAVSRWLGYRTNAVYRWEAGKDVPTAARYFELARRSGLDLRLAQKRFWHLSPYAEVDLSSPSGIAHFLRQLRGKLTITAITQRCGASRTQVSRWLSGAAEPALPNFLAVIEATSLRLLDFIAALVEPELLPSIATAHRALQALRTAAHDAPWTQAILRGLETIDYQRLPRHQTGWLSLRLGIPLLEEERCLELLRQTGQITWSDERYVPTHILAVDTRRSEEANRAQRRFWLSVASERLEQGRPGVWSYNVFGVSRASQTTARGLLCTNAHYHCCV